MISAPSLSGAALLIGLSLFLGFAYEDFFAHSNIRRPGGIRTFPILASAGGVLYLFDPAHFVPFTAGLVVLGIWLAVFYRQHIGERDEEGEPNVGLVVPALNIHAYLLGPIALALPRGLRSVSRSSPFFCSPGARSFTRWRGGSTSTKSLPPANF
jgi:hypothetical protein